MLALIPAFSKEFASFAYKMFSNKEYDDNSYNFAADLLPCIRKRYAPNWELDWRNDLFLGGGCHFIRRFDKHYKAYKYASLKFDRLDLPSSLLVSLAKCYNAPGEPSMSIEDAKKLSKAAIGKKTSIEAVTLKRNLQNTEWTRRFF